MIKENAIVKNWVLVGVITGLLACVIYPLLIFLPMPTAVTIIFACSFGPLLSVASIGIYHLLKINRKTVTVQIATMFNIIAGTIASLMLIVQLAIRVPMFEYLKSATDDSTKEMFRWVWKVVLGLDVSWDVYISIGTFLFAFNMMTHPRFGKVFGLAGMIIAVLLLGFNIQTFPDPPAEAGLVDLGPMVGLWYTAVAIQAYRSLRWVESELRSC